jgi:hypothetical protein
LSNVWTAKKFTEEILSLEQEVHNEH